MGNEEDFSMAWRVILNAVDEFGRIENLVIGNLENSENPETLLYRDDILVFAGLDDFGFYLRIFSSVSTKSDEPNEVIAYSGFRNYSPKDVPKRIWVILRKTVVQII